MILSILLGCGGPEIVVIPAAPDPWQPDPTIERAALLLRADLALGAEGGAFAGALADLRVIEHRWLMARLSEDNLIIEL